MGGTRRYPRAEALAIGEELVRALEPHCERIEIAGSIRRGKPDVGDVEILYVPKFGTGLERGSMFESEINLAQRAIETLERDGILKRRLSATGQQTWGEKNKLAVHCASGIPVDLFASTIPNWWVSLVIRTGSAETNLRLTTGAQRLGRTLHAYGSGVSDSSNAVLTPATSERDVFDLCGVPYLDPNER